MIRAARLGVAALFAATLSVVAPAPVSAESQTYFQTTPITFSGNSEGGASAYPSQLVVSALEGPITDVDVNINAIDMGNLARLHLMLVSPGGEAEVLKTYKCNGTVASTSILTFDQQAASGLSEGACADGTYRPTMNCPPGYCGFFPTYAGTRSANLDNFNGENANGTWKLYAYRTCQTTCPSNGERIAAGWSLSIETGPYDVDLPAGSATKGPAGPYPATRTIPIAAPDQGLITDLEVDLNGVFHTHPFDLEIVLEKVGGPRVMLLAHACGGAVTSRNWIWDDEAPTAMPPNSATDNCVAGRYRPTNNSPGVSLPAPAPPAPYGSSLSVFDLTDPRGEWRMWINDNDGGNEGFITQRFQLSMTTRPRAATSWSVSSLSVGEGQTGTLTVRRQGATAYAAGSVKVASSASAGDFEEISQTLTFAPGQLTRTVAVEITDDTVDEAAESFTVTLSGATGDARLVSPTTATVTIPESDGADDRAPETSITKAPKARTHKSRAKVTFAADEAGARFQCRLDKGRWKACTSPTRLTNLAPGKHKLKVRAVDAAGNVESRPAVVRWRVLPRQRGGVL